MNRLVRTSLRVSNLRHSAIRTCTTSSTNASKAVPKKDKSELPRRQVKQSTGRIIGRAIGASTVIGGIAVAAWAYQQEDNDGDNDANPVTKVFSTIKNAIWENIVKPFADPPSDSLLPDFPPLPPGMEQPRTLVIALDKMMVSSKWNRKEGWVVEKRPGLDRFLALMSQYYEIILWDNQGALNGLAYLEAIDPKQQYFSGMLWRDATTWRFVGTGGKYTKDLSKINRDLTRVIMLETDKSVPLQHENTIMVKPFGHGDTEDEELLDLIPFLENVCMRNVEDVRKELAKYEGQESVGKAYNMEKSKQLQLEREEMNKGIGGTLRLLRGNDKDYSPKMVIDKNMLPPMPPMTGGPGAPDLAGPGMPGMPPSAVKPPVRDPAVGPHGKATLWSHIRDYVKDGEEEAKVMFEEWQMYMMQEQMKHDEKMKKQRQAAMMKNMPAQ